MAQSDETQKNLEKDYIRDHYPKLPDRVIEWIVDKHGSMNAFVAFLIKPQEQRIHDQLSQLGQGNFKQSEEIAKIIAGFMEEPAESIFSSMIGSESERNSLQERFPKLPMEVIDLIIEKGGLIKYLDDLVEQGRISRHYHQSIMLNLGREGTLVGTWMLAVAFTEDLGKPLETVFPYLLNPILDVESAV